MSAVLVKRGAADDAADTYSDANKLRIVPSRVFGWSSRGCFATPADFPRHDCSPYSHLHVRRERLQVSLVQRPFSVAPCQTSADVPIFAPFASPRGDGPLRRTRVQVGGVDGVAEPGRRLHPAAGRWSGGGVGMAPRTTYPGRAGRGGGRGAAARRAQQPTRDALAARRLASSWRRGEGAGERSGSSGLATHGFLMSLGGGGRGAAARRAQQPT
jgi:hypothetical protein